MTREQAKAILVKYGILLKKDNNSNELEDAINVAVDALNRPDEEQDFLDKCAIAAMQGICVNAGRNRYSFDKPNPIAEQSYKIAQAMLKARKEAMQSENI